MTGHNRQTAIAVALSGSVGHPCGGIRRLSGFPFPESDDTPQHTDKAEQEQEYNFRFYGYRSVCLTFTKRTCLLIV